MERVVADFPLTAVPEGIDQLTGQTAGWRIEVELVSLLAAVRQYLDG